MSKEKKRKQHYIPRFYLKSFAVPKKGEYYTNCFEKSNFKQFEVNIKDVGCENYFYEIAKDVPQEMEDTLSEFENEFSQVYNKLVSRASVRCLKWKEKEVFAQFIIVQEARTLEMREKLRDMVKSLNNWLLDKRLSKEHEKEIKEISTEEGIRDLHLGIIKRDLSENSAMVDMLLNMKWAIFENNTAFPFWTSDHPVNRYNPYDFSPYGNLGLLCRGIEVFFPLTPKLGLSICDPIEYFFGPEKSACIEDNVLFYNTLQLGANTRHIFSINSDFSIAKKWLSEFPKSAAFDRKRISTDIKINPEYSQDSYFYDPTFRYRNYKKYRS